MYSPILKCAIINTTYFYVVFTHSLNVSKFKLPDGDNTFYSPTNLYLVFHFDHSLKTYLL